MEYNDKNQESEFSYQNEMNVSESEFSSLQCEEIIYSESVLQEENSDSQAETQKTAKSTSSSSKITTAVAAVIGVAVLAISVVSGTASFSKFDIHGTSVDYTLETTIEYNLEEEGVIDFDNFDTNLRMITFSDETENSSLIALSTANEELASETVVVSQSESGGEVEISFSGRIVGLYEGTKYTTQVVGEDSSGNLKVYLEKSFTTTGAQTEFSEVSWLCQCQVDGCFYFTMEYIDENSYYDNFHFKMISQDTGEVFAEGDIISPEKEQCVNVEEAVGMDYILEISFDSQAPIDVEGGESAKVYQINVKI